MTAKILPVTGPQVWRVADMQRNKSWLKILSPTIFDDAVRIAREAAASGRTQDDFDFESVDLPELRAALSPAVHELGHGTGVVLLRGLDISGLQSEVLKLSLLIIGNHMGLIGPQEHRAKGIAEVTDSAPAGNGTYYYHVGGPLPMHMDPADIVGLLCVRKASRGGESLIVSSMAVHNELLAARPDILDLLYRGYKHRRREHRRNGGSALTDHYCPVFADIGGEIICNYLPAPIEMAVADGLMNLTPLEAEAMQLLESTAQREDLCMTMDIEPGDIQLLNNRIVMHGRKDYTDEGGEDRRRLLLRLWLTMRGWRKYPAHIPHTDSELQTEPA